MAKELDLFKIADHDKNSNRAFLKGVYHDKGYKIATDGRMMAVIKAEYKEKYEGKIIGKDFFEIQGQYPKYEKVIPNVCDYKEMAFNVDKFLHLCKKADLFKKYKTLVTPVAEFRDSDAFAAQLLFDSETVPGIRAFLSAYPDAKLYRYNEDTVKDYHNNDIPSDTMKALYFYDEKADAKLVFMPYNRKAVSGVVVNDKEIKYIPDEEVPLDKHFYERDCMLARTNHFNIVNKDTDEYDNKDKKILEEIAVVQDIVGAA